MTGVSPLRNIAIAPITATASTTPATARPATSRASSPKIRFGSSTDGTVPVWVSNVAAAPTGAMPLGDEAMFGIDATLGAVIAGIDAIDGELPERVPTS